MEQQKETDQLSPAEKTTSSDKVSRAISIVALVISAAAFMVQYVAHDQLIYDVSKTNIYQHSSPVRATVQNVLVIYNLGNRSGALLEANATMIDFNPEKEKSDQACEKKTGLIWLSTVNAISSEKVLGQYGSVVEAGKIVLQNLQFSLPTGAASGLPHNAVVCLDLTFSDSRGATPAFHKPLAQVQLVAEDGNVVRYDVQSSADPEHSYRVFSKTYWQAPFLPEWFNTWMQGR
jgi:hypothetical protein